MQISASDLIAVAGYIQRLEQWAASRNDDWKFFYSGGTGSSQIHIQCLNLSIRNVNIYGSSNPYPSFREGRGHVWQYSNSTSDPYYANPEEAVFAKIICTYEGKEAHLEDVLNDLKHAETLEELNQNE